MRTQDPLEPPCVFLITTRGAATFTGFIRTTTDGQFETVVVANQCGNVQGPGSVTSRVVREVSRLDDVVIAGRKGGIVITRKATAAGDPQSPEGVRSVSQLEIRGSTGQLKHIRGNGLAVGRTTLTETFQTYWVEIELDEDD